jgi:hypothetical protein
MIPRVTLRKALADPMLLGAGLASDSWLPWRTLLIAAMGEELTDHERGLFKQFTGRDREPLQPIEEFVGVVGIAAGSPEPSRPSRPTSPDCASIPPRSRESAAFC